MSREHGDPLTEIVSTLEDHNNDIPPVGGYTIGGLALDGYAIDLVVQPNIVGRVISLGLASLGTAAFIRARHLYSSHREQ